MNIYDIKKYIFEKELVPLVLETIGMHNLYNNGKYISCAYPDGDNKNGCIVYLSEFLNVTSYTREIDGKFQNIDIVDLVNYVCKFNNLHLAINKIKEICNISYIQAENKKKIDYGNSIFKKKKSNKDNVSMNIYSKEILNKYYDSPHINLFYEGILPKTIKYFDIKFDVKTDRIVFPHFNLSNKNEILSLIGRTVNPFYKELNKPKYLTILGVGYKKTSNLYGLAHNIENIKKEKKVILFEGEKSVLKSWQMGYKIGLSVGCHSISKEQIKILLSLNIEEVIISFDKDVALENIIKEIELLKIYFKVTVIYDKYNLLDEKDSPVDKGKKVFDILYKYRRSIKELNEI